MAAGFLLSSLLLFGNAWLPPTGTILEVRAPDRICVGFAEFCCNRHASLQDPQSGPANISIDNDTKSILTDSIYKKSEADIMSRVNKWARRI